MKGPKHEEVGGSGKFGSKRVVEAPGGDDVKPTVPNLTLT